MKLKSYSSGMDYKCTLHVMIQVHSHNQYYSCTMLVLIAHPCDQLAYALTSYAPHAFTLILLELVASAMHFSCKLQLNKCMYESACQ